MTPRREELLDIAERVLEAEGLERFGTGSLARAAQIKPPSLYKHFDGLAEIHVALISRGFQRLGQSLGDAEGDLAIFAAKYREAALGAPQLYRLMSDRKLDRDLLERGSELAAMQPLLEYFGETESKHPMSRSAWAWAHGLASLEIADRFPPGADIDGAWQVLVTTLARA